MQTFPRIAATALAASLVLAFAACKPGPAGAGKPGAAAAKSDKADPDAVPGLPTEKDRNSYMVGMALGRQFEPMKDQIDVDVVVKAMKASLAGEKLLLTNEQAQAIGEKFQRQVAQAQMEKAIAEAKANVEKGRKFLAENAKKPGVQTTASGLQYQVLQAGNGPKPKATDTVRVNYRGTLLDGTEFDASAQHGGPANLPLPQMVDGWKEGIPLMPVGSKYRFWIPADLGFGEQGTPGGPIPPNATLVFDVELLGIETAGGQAK